ncbi:MAG: ArgE/DapE family deacylase [Thermoleophilaceae bacterium]
MSEVDDLLGSLVAIDSVNPDLVPGGAGEAEIAAFVAGWLRDAGLEVELDEAAPGRVSVVGVVRGSGGGRSLMLNAHMDTVGVEGMERPFDPVVRDGRLYGRGAYDMKGSLAACMLAAARLVSGGLRGDVLVTAVADEEHASIGCQSVLRRWHADAAIVTEPTALRVCVAHKGFVWLAVETRGRAAHGSRPAEGVDAIVKMGPVLVRLDELGAALAERAHPLVGAPSLHASLIEGGQELSSYPERCVLQVERRTVPGESEAQVVAEFEKLVERCRADDPSLEIELRPGLARDPFEVPQSADIVAALARQVAAATGVAAELYGDTPWMDAALCQAAGIPTVVFGPGGTGAHAVEEYVELADVAVCADVLEATAREVCA